MGEECNECLPGYAGNPERGEPCVANELTPVCDCDSRGTALPCRDNNCICKVKKKKAVAYNNQLHNYNVTTFYRPM